MPTPKTVAVMTLWSVLIEIGRGHNVCSNFGLVMTNTINKMKIKDISTYHSKDCRLIDYIAIHLSIHYCTKVLQGARKTPPLSRSPPSERDVTWYYMAQPHAAVISRKGTRLDCLALFLDMRAVDFLLVSVIYRIVGKFRRRKCS